MRARRVHRHAARKVGAMGSAKRLARAAPATAVFQLAVVAERNSNGIGLPLRRRLIFRGAAAAELRRSARRFQKTAKEPDKKIGFGTRVLTAHAFFRFFGRGTANSGLPSFHLVVECD